MIFYTQETSIGLLIASIPAVLSVYLYFNTEKKNLALLFLLLSALLLRLLMISLDPFIHEWDERYHALVAKNMLSFPFKPMLVVHPIMAYDPNDWSNNHIWVHKQPLFLWQMAASMKLFGISTFALRLPSAIMGTLLVWLTYELSKTWTGHRNVAFVAAWLVTFSHYTLEMIAGRMSLEHNDLAFLFYVTCTFWAFTRYIRSDFAIRWALLIGVFTGMAILNKWLTALLVYGGWGLYILQSKEYRFQIKKYSHIGLSLLAAAIIAVPWQVYILNAFPVESAIAFGYNVKHMVDDLGHPGTAWTHLGYLPYIYHQFLLYFGVAGIIAAFYIKEVNLKWSISSLAMIVVIYAFFSLLVKTKMPALVLPVASLIFTFFALGWYFLYDGFADRLQMPAGAKQKICSILLLITAFVTLKPAEIVKYRNADNTFRNNKLQNASVYKNLPTNITKDRIIINCKSFENVELMYYTDAKAYHWYPEQRILDSLQLLGYRIAAFQNVVGQELPLYITEDPEIILIPDKIN